MLIAFEVLALSKPAISPVFEKCAHDSSTVVAVGESFAFDSALEMPKSCVSLRRRQMLERTKVPQQRSREYGKGLSRLSPHDSPGDEGDDILSKLSVSSLHQIKHIHGSGARPSVAAMVGRKMHGDQSWEPTSMSPFINQDPNREQATL